MTTERPKVQGYILPDIHKRFIEWKQSKGIEKESEALNRLLSEYFQVNHGDTPTIHSITEDRVRELITQAVEPLQAKIDSLTHQIEALAEVRQITDNLPNELPTDAIESHIDVTGESLSESVQESPEEKVDAVSSGHSGVPPENVSDEVGISHKNVALPITSTEEPIPKTFTQKELAVRLKKNSATLYRNQNKPTFSQWSKQLDPDDVAWKYDEKTKQFEPIYDGKSIPKLFLS